MDPVGTGNPLLDAALLIDNVQLFSGSFSGSFTYNVTDGSLESNFATVSIMGQPGDTITDAGA